MAEGRVKLAPAKALQPEPAGPHWSDRSYFLDDNGLVCNEGPVDVVEGALALMKAGLQGALYNFSSAHRAVRNSTCAAQGYGFAEKAFISTDSCYPGLTVSYKDPKGARAFATHQREALTAYGRRWDLDIEKVEKMHACTCHPMSPLKAKASMECSDVLNGMSGSWVHRRPQDQSGLMCDGGPFLEATFALAILKSTGDLPMHLFDQIAPVTCDHLGFPHMSPTNDPCFTKLHMWTKTPDADTDQGVFASRMIENTLLSQKGFTNFSFTFGLNDGVLERIPGCHCSPDSNVTKGVSYCEMVGDGASSPLRGMWEEWHEE